MAKQQPTAGAGLDSYVEVLKDPNILLLHKGDQVASYAAIHGRAEGDKQKQGDLKTPEGVYFITRKVAEKLDPMEYGAHAFATDYPNPVDKIRGKGGSGIWLHSKGYPIAGKSTRGCVAVGAEDMELLRHEFKRGLPVVIRRSGAKLTPAEEQEKRQLEQKCGEWAARRTLDPAERYALYDRELFEKGSGQRFADYIKKSEAERPVPAKKSDVIGKVLILRGTGYWVTAFADDQVKTGRAQKIVCLYWMEIPKKGYRIVGERRFALDR